MNHFQDTIQTTWKNTQAFFQSQNKHFYIPYSHTLNLASLTHRPRFYHHLLRSISLIGGVIIGYNPYTVADPICVFGDKNMVINTIELLNHIILSTERAPHLSDTRMNAILRLLEHELHHTNAQDKGVVIFWQKEMLKDYPKYSLKPHYKIFRFYVY